ncbi:MAG: 3-phosphoglycerate kinase [Bacillales bacterium]|jgi:PPP family 3-phenylpropionic acid transporter|nr:3-phosphoglycerate kinase [Bacillales bacterium]
MNTQKWMNIQFFSFFMSWGVFLPYWTGWMIHTKGITVSQASLIMSVGLATRGITTLFVYPYLSGKCSSKNLLNGMAFGTLLAIIFYIPANTFLMLMVVTIVLHLFFPTLMPALDSAAGVLVQNNKLQHYGKSRSWGSIGFVVAGIFLTVLTGVYGEKMIFWALLIGTFAFSCLGIMKAPADLYKRSQKRMDKSKSILKLVQYKHFGIVLLIVILLQAAHASYYNYGYIYLQHIKAPKYLVGMILNIAVISEIVFFMIADRKFQNLTVGSLLSIATLGSTVRWIILFTFPNIFAFCIAQTLHACSFAMGHYAFMKYLIKNIPHDQIPRAQGIYSSLALSWGTAFLTIFGGYLYDIEPRYAFLGMIVFTIPSLLVSLIYKKLENEK